MTRSTCPGYSLLLSEDPIADHLGDLPWMARRDFLLDMAILGEAVFNACRPDGAWRINYEVLGNSWPHLHAHVHARYEWEAAEMKRGPVWRYPQEKVDAQEHVYDDGRHGTLRAAIAAELERLMPEAYAAV